VKSVVRVTCLVGILVCLVAANVRAAQKAPDRASFVFATYVEDAFSERKAALLVDSIRRFGGCLAHAPIYVAVKDMDRVPLPNLRTRDAVILPLEVDPMAGGYPLATKVFAAAQVERLVAKHARTLLWLDPWNLLLGPPTGFELDRGAAVALRPVHVVNVGLPVGQPVDAYWSRIYEISGVDPTHVPTIEPLVDPQPIRFYVNCGIIAFRPSLGLCQEWASRFVELVKDDAYQTTACPDFRHRLFLHQAVLSGLILGRTTPGQRRWLPVELGYPLEFHLKGRIPAAQRIEDLGRVVGFFVEQSWEQQPDWMKTFKVDEPLKTWLAEAQQRLHRVVDRIFREEGQCNSYLVRTAAGDVMIDPGGAASPDSFLWSLAGRRPVEAILLTHGHEDHRDGIALWRGDRTIPVVAQREIVEYIRYRDRLAGFFRTRDAAHTGAPGRPRPEVAVETPIEATELFADDHSYRLGGLTFQHVHTGGETPDTSLIWVPELKAAFLGDNFYDSFPMLYTPRGTKPRWALDYVKALEKALELGPEVLLQGHGDPVVGARFVSMRLREYRDAIRHVHDATVEGMNGGKDVFTLMREITLPPGSRVGQFYGRVSWSVRGIYEGYAGWFDGNPANLYDQPPTVADAELVRLAGGPGAVIGRARKVLESGDALMALRLAEAALAAEPDNAEGKAVRVEALKVLRARSHNGAERNWLDFAAKQ
jgi:glyoxylase-like metal-dependent hydrolase (beta-lactamase superfamily II)